MAWHKLFYPLYHYEHIRWDIYATSPKTGYSLRQQDRYEGLPAAKWSNLLKKVAKMNVYTSFIHPIKPAYQTAE